MNIANPPPPEKNLPDTSLTPWTDRGAFGSMAVCHYYQCCYDYILVSLRNGIRYFSFVSLPLPHSGQNSTTKSSTQIRNEGAKMVGPWPLGSSHRHIFLR